MLVDCVLWMEGDGPEDIIFPMNWVDVEGWREVLVDPGGWMMNLLWVRVLRMLVV